ncbi:MAG: hypothetical protein ABSD50_04750 [Smithella sp.]
MTSKLTKMVFVVSAALLFVIVITVVTSLRTPTPVYALAPTQYKVLMYQELNPNGLEAMLNITVKDGWQFVEMAGPFVIFRK